MYTEWMAQTSRERDRLRKAKLRRVGRTPDVLRKSGPMRDRTKYTRKVKHKGGDL